MTEFYKGQIIDTNNLKRYTCGFDLIKDEYNPFAMHIYNLFDKMVEEQSTEKKKELDEIFLTLFKPKSIMDTGKEIIYEKRVDEHGNAYGREIISGLIFPIKHEYSSYDVTYYRNHLKEVYFDKKSRMVYSFGEGSSMTFYLVDDNISLETYVPHEEQRKLANMHIGEKRVIVIQGQRVNVECTVPSSLKVEIKPELTFPSDKKINYAIVREGLANELEVHNYLEPFAHGLFKRNKVKEYSKQLLEMFLKNKLGNYVLVEEKKKEGPTKIKKM